MAMPNLTDIFVPMVKEGRFHPQFRSLLNSPYHSEARSLINALYQRMGEPSKTFIRKFQTDNFHSHLFEIACFAYLESAGLKPNRNHSSPDFLASRNGLTLAIEAATANPSNNQAADISLLQMKELPDEELANKVNDEFPRRISSILQKKLKHQYDKLPQCAGSPLILMVAPFFEAGSVYYTDESLVDCLYGVNRTTPGFFSLPEAESVSAVLYCSAFTVPRFFRLATPLDDTAKVRATREGKYYAVESDGELLEREYQYRIGSPSSPKETWHEGVTLFLNHNARIPISKEILPCTSSFSTEDSYLVREVRGFHPMTSFMRIYPNNETT
jgi:hypothetical protein